MVEQKDVMQMIGAWGYDTLSFQKYLDERMDMARDVGDAVGMTAYKSLMALSLYAKTSDGKLSVFDGNSLDPRMKEMVGDEIFEAVKESLGEDEFPEKVLDTLYEHCSIFPTVHEAEMRLRRDVFLTVIPFIVDKMQTSASNVSGDVLQMLIGLEAAASSKKKDGILFAQKTSENIKLVVEKLFDVVDRIMMCKYTPDEGVNDISSHIIGDVVKMTKNVSEDILSIIDRPPQAWVDFAANFGRFMLSFQLATSLGYVDYDTYNRIFEEIKSIKNDEHKPLFGKN